MRLVAKTPPLAVLLQMIRFGITGITAAFIHLLTVISLVHLFQLHPLSANLYGFLLGFIISFSGNRFWTFSTSSIEIRSSFVRFFLIASVNFILNQTLYYFLLVKMNQNYILSLVATLGFIAFITFLFNKFWVFKEC